MALVEERTQRRLEQRRRVHVALVAQRDDSIDDGNGQATYGYAPSTQITLRADLTYFKDGLAGSHEFMTGFFGAPRSTYDTTSVYLNNGLIMEEQRQIDPADLSKGTVPFHRRSVSPLELTTRQARDRNFALYLQDNWKPMRA